MPYFFATADNGRVQIVGSDARHLAGPLRSRAGQRIKVIDPKDGQRGELLEVRLDHVSPQRVEGIVESVQPHQPEPELAITVGLALLPETALKAALSRCTELGAASFCLIRAERSGPREISASKLERYREICREAAMLAGRLRVPPVEGPVDFASLTMSGPILLERTAPLRLADLPLSSGQILLIGPEGGWSPAEQARNGFQKASLGSRNLRAENAAPTALAVALARSRDL